jgi:hydrogenase nickel incorporation protein HypA/HybF
VHELGLCSSIVDAVEKRAGDRPVRRVRVRVGRLHHVHPDAFDQSFAIAAMGTVAEGAGADLVLLPVTARCQGCGTGWEGDDLPVVCPSCGAPTMELTGGDELVLESIEYRAKEER